MDGLLNPGCPFLHRGSQRFGLHLQVATPNNVTDQVKEGRKTAHRIVTEPFSGANNEDPY